jgi:hypothetical protein
VTLTNKQISALDERANEFQAGDHQTQEEIVEEFFDSFKVTHPQG